MGISIVEIKARCSDTDRIRHFLEEKGARFVGIDHQIDTYFVVPNGRLKLREGNIEQTLIHYNRPNQAEPKTSQVSLYRPHPDAGLKKVLEEALGTKVVVDKKRAIYFIENVKFHLDEVQNLGTFMEIEAIDEKGVFTEEELLQQCQFYKEQLKIEEKDLVHYSYSDLLMELERS